MNITWISGKTKVTEVNTNNVDVERLDVLQSLDKRLNGKIYTIYNYNAYQACIYCKKSVKYNFEKKIYNYDQSVGTVTLIPPECDCGVEITDETVTPMWNVNILVHKDEEAEPWAVMTLFKNQITQDNKFQGDRDREFFGWLIGHNVDIVYEERKDWDGKMKNFILNIQINEKLSDEGDADIGTVEVPW